MSAGHRLQVPTFKGWAAAGACFANYSCSRLASVYDLCHTALLLFAGEHVRYVCRAGAGERRCGYAL